MKTSKTLSLVLSLAVCLLAISSCKRENVPTGSVSGKIQTKVAMQGTKSSSFANEKINQTIVLDESDGLLLQEFVSDNFSQPVGADDIRTKGTVITTDNIGKVYGQFGMEGFLDNASDIDCPEESWPKVYINGEYKKLADDHYVIGGKSTYSESSEPAWTLKDGNNQQYPWLNNIDFTFWSYAPVEHSGEYAYVSDGEKARGKMAITGYEIPTSSEEQKDLLIAYNTRSYPGDDKGDDVNILFRHALPDIYFDVTEISKYGITVENITINGVYNEGNCTVTSADLYDDDVTKAFSWSPVTESGTTDFEMEGSSDHFFMIPQEFSGSITISLSNGKTLTTALSTNWQAGKYYKYKLTYNGIEISVDDDVNGNEKENVVIKSTEASTVKCYIRALIIGNWHQNLGTISEPVPGAVMAPWSLSDGTFSPSLAATAGTAVNNWVLGTDGFYYYKYPVYPNTETGTGADGKGTPDKLFKTYTAPEDAPVAGTYLNLSIVAQAVKWDADKIAVTQAWGETAAGYLSATDKGSSN